MRRELEKEHSSYQVTFMCLCSQEVFGSFCHFVLLILCLVALAEGQVDKDSGVEVVQVESSTKIKRF